MKGYQYYVAVGALKKYGYENNRFVTIKGDERSYKQLFSRPPVKDPKAQKFIPHADGTVRTLDGLIIVRLSDK